MPDLLRQNLNPQRLGCFLSIGLLLAVILSSLESHTGYYPIKRQESLDLGLLAIFVGGVVLLLNQWLAAGRVLISLSLSAYAIFLLNYFVLSPSKSFFLIIGYCLAMFFLWHLKREEYLPKCESRMFYEQLNVTVAIGLLANWALVFILAPSASSTASIEILIGSAFLLMCILRYSRLSSFSVNRKIAVLVVLSFAAASAYTVLSGQELIQRMGRASILIPILALTVSLPLRELRSRFGSTLEAIFFHPEGAILITFVGLCVGGSLLLNLPMQASVPGKINWVDATFTAVSAVCVTGLATVDISSVFSPSGQASVLLLIQLGGLGIMSLSSLALLFVGERLSLRQETALISTFGQKIKGEIRGLVLRIIWVTLSIEGIGAVILTLLFKKHDMSWIEALCQGVFTSISAFCNAGFFLHSQSLMPYNRDPLILYSISMLIILGGISPGFIYSQIYLRRFRLTSLQFNMMAFATVGLLFFGTFMFLLTEWSGSFAALSVSDKIHNAWFLSASTRTAGFNSTNMLLLTPATQLVAMFLMFVGGSPGGTAGGIKTTSFMVMIFAIVSVARGRSEVEAFARRIPYDTVLRATAVTLLGLTLGLFFFMALLLTQNIAPYPLLFEVVSALGTVGLSVGATGQLDDLGKFLIMACMFMGRVGPLSVFLFFGQAPKRKTWTLPEEAVIVS